jgi:cytidylate kinase
VKQALRARNRLDKQRKISPLLKHRNSIIVNSQKLNKKEMVEKMSKHIEKVINI